MPNQVVLLMYHAKFDRNLVTLLISCHSLMFLRYSTVIVSHINAGTTYADCNFLVYAIVIVTHTDCIFLVPTMLILAHKILICKDEINKTMLPHFYSKCG